MSSSESEQPANKNPTLCKILYTLMADDDTIIAAYARSKRIDFLLPYSYKTNEKTCSYLQKIDATADRRGIQGEYIYATVCEPRVEGVLKALLAIDDIQILNMNKVLTPFDENHNGFTRTIFHCKNFDTLKGILDPRKMYEIEGWVDDDEKPPLLTIQTIKARKSGMYIS